MPAKVFRVMKVEDDKPMSGSGSAMLGVRASDMSKQEELADLDFVEPNSGGMSVAGCVRTLYIPLLPRRFEKLDPKRFRGASAGNSQKIWATGDDPYIACAINNELHLKIEDQTEPPGHGLVHPSRNMPYVDFKNALEGTQNSWQIDEAHPDECAVCERYGVE